MSEFSTTVRALHHWIAPALKTVGTDAHLPAITWARLDVAPSHALLSTTDRFAASLSRVRLDPDHGESEPVTVHVEGGALSRVLAVFRTRGRADPAVTVTVTESAVTFVSGPHRFTATTVEGQRVGTPAAGTPLNAPDIKRLFADALRDEKAAPFNAPMTVDFARLAAFKAAAPKREAVVMRQAPGGPGKPYLMRMGEDYLGLLMPRRWFSGEDDGPPPMADGWHDALNLTTGDTK